MPFQIDITFSYYYLVKYLVHWNFIVLKIALLWCIQYNNEKHTYVLIGKVCDTQKLILNAIYVFLYLQNIFVSNILTYIYACLCAWRNI